MQDSGPPGPGLLLQTYRMCQLSLGENVGPKNLQKLVWELKSKQKKKKNVTKAVTLFQFWVFKMIDMCFREMVCVNMLSILFVHRIKSILFMLKFVFYLVSEIHKIFFDIL